MIFSKALKCSKEDGSKIALVNPKPISTLVLPWEPLIDSTTHNSILNVLSGPSELVQMKLLYSTCVPILMYASDVVCFPGKEIQSLHVAVNDTIRRIFSYHRWGSIRTLRESLGYLSITDIFAKRKRVFDKRLPQIGNAVLSFFARN